MEKMRKDCHISMLALTTGQKISDKFSPMRVDGKISTYTVSIFIAPLTSGKGVDCWLLEADEGVALGRTGDGTVVEVICGYIISE